MFFFNYINKKKICPSCLKSYTYTDIILPGITNVNYVMDNNCNNCKYSFYEKNKDIIPI